MVMSIYITLVNFSSSAGMAARAVHNARWSSSAEDPFLAELTSTVTATTEAVRGHEDSVKGEREKN